VASAFGKGFLKHSLFGEVNARPVVKSPKADLRLYYQRALEASVIAALLVVIAAFRFLPVCGSKTRIAPVVQLASRIRKGYHRR